MFSFQAFIIINILIAIANNNERIHNIKNGITKQIDHGFWFGFYCLLCAPVIYFSGWKIGVVVFLEHGWFFPMFYNVIALGWPDIFHLSTTSRATYDKTIVNIITWLNKKFHADLPFSMLVPDLIVFVTSLFFLWL